MPSSSAIRSFKFYMSGDARHREVGDDDVLLEGFRKSRRSDRTPWCACIARPAPLIDRARAELTRKKEGTLADWEDAHPAVAEALGDPDRGYLAKLAGAHLYVVHLSSHQGLEVVRAARRSGARFTVETTTPYLGINSHDPNGLLVKMCRRCAPRASGSAVEGLLEGSINTVGTDNTSRVRATKRPEPVCTARGRACPPSGTHLPALLHYGRLRGIPLDVLVERATRGPAGSTASIRRRARSRSLRCRSRGGRSRARGVVRAEDLQGMSDFSPFEGKTLRGWPVVTIKGGTIIARDGKIVAKANGRYLVRKPAPARQLEWFGRATA